MNDINKGGPDFPIPLLEGQSWQEMAPCDGMTLRQYAAIKLKVPNSGLDWLDDMIRESLRDELAGKAMQTILGLGVNYEYGGNAPKNVIPKDAYQLADAMLKARENKE